VDQGNLINDTASVTSRDEADKAQVQFERVPEVDHLLNKNGVNTLAALDVNGSHSTNAL